jgi:hypothetical protein
LDLPMPLLPKPLKSAPSPSRIKKTTQVVVQPIEEVDGERAVSRSPSKSRLFSDLTDEQLKHLQRMHLIIDLDATFVSTRTDMSSYPRARKAIQAAGKEAADEALSRTFIFALGSTRMWTILRPGAMDFIEFASFYFKNIFVWSAGQSDYVEQIVSFLFPAHIPRPSVIFSWDDCRVEKKECDMAASPSKQEYVMFSKPLTDMIPHFPTDDSAHPLATMLILDDRRDIAEHNVDNLVQIPPFEPRLTTEALTAKDTCLDDFAEWLMRPEVVVSKDIRRVDKSCIFGKAT